MATTIFLRFSVSPTLVSPPLSFIMLLPLKIALYFESSQYLNSMKSFRVICLSVFFVVIAVFLSGDADLPILFATSPPERAFQDKVVWITGIIGFVKLRTWTKLHERGIVGNRCCYGNGAGQYECKGYPVGSKVQYHA